MNEKETIKQELDELSPFLSKLRAEQADDGFATPPRYFRQLTETVLAQSQPTTPFIGFWQRIAFWLQPKYVGYALAAIVVLAITVPLFWPQPEADLPGISSEEAIAYIEANLSDFDTELLLQEVEGLDATDFDVPPEDVEEYLQENMNDWTIEELETLF